jgi:hypothetical protein
MITILLAVILSPAGFLHDDAAADRLIREAMQSTYDLQLTAARSACKALQEKYADHPAGYTLMAETYWWEAQMDPGNASIENLYYVAQKTAVEKAENALKLNKYPKIEVTAYLASAHGSYARFQVTQKQAYYSALRAGLRAHRLADEVYQMDKMYYDIYVGTGAFNFFTGSLPAVIKPFAWLIGARGDRNLGIEQLKTAMDQARYSQTEARIVYYTAMREDKNYAEAFRVLQSLMSDYRDNFVFYTWMTDWYQKQERALEGIVFFERLFNDEAKRSLPVAKNALLEKAQLQQEEKLRANAIQTIDRLKMLPDNDPLLIKKIQALEKTVAK